MLSLFPRDVLDEIWDLIESVSEGFPTYFCQLIRAAEKDKMDRGCCEVICGAPTALRGYGID